MIQRDRIDRSFVNPENKSGAVPRQKVGLSSALEVLEVAWVKFWVAGNYWNCTDGEMGYKAGCLSEGRCTHCEKRTVDTVALRVQIFCD